VNSSNHETVRLVAFTRSGAGGIASPRSVGQKLFSRLLQIVRCADMFPYEPALCDAVETPPQSIADVLLSLRKIQIICVDGDGLKWFNWLYLQVTEAVEARIAAGGFAAAEWLAELDVHFARLYFSALYGAILGQPISECWQVLFGCRNQALIARIQFALAGINAHINHDLPEAIVSTCEATGTVPQHGTQQFNDYTSLNATLNRLIESAKHQLHVRLLGDALPAASRLEDTIAAWSVTAGREAAWNNAEVLWHLHKVPPLDSSFLDTLDGLTTVTNKVLLVPVP
jgi:hypothetical protein